jgi:RNA polymerase sigma factor (sigma-70 family)
VSIVNHGRSSSRHLTETELVGYVHAAQEGDQQALDGVVRALVDDVYGLALRMTANVADAEDVTQEVMIKVVTRLGSFRAEASVRTWAYQIAVRHILDRRKSRIESLGLDLEQFASDLLDGLASPAEPEDPLAVQEVKLGCTLAMLTCLDREHRLAYVLGEVFDMPGDTAAELTGVSLDVFRQRLSRARRQLEAFTESYCSIVDAKAPCSCERRVQRATELGRIQPRSLTLATHPRRGIAAKGVHEMETLHATAALFRGHPDYAAPEVLPARILEVIATSAPEILAAPSRR